MVTVVAQLLFGQRQQWPEQVDALLAIGASPCGEDVHSPQTVDTAAPYQVHQYRLRLIVGVVAQDHDRRPHRVSSPS